LLAACGDDEAATVEATIADHGDALTDDGGDRLFNLEITAADEAYALGELELEVVLADGTAVLVEAELSTDADGDGDVGAGDVVTGIEPADDVLGASAIGEAFDVTLRHAPADGDPVDLWNGVWTAG
jgi:hypothetical protein